jgi:hypothetical protein
LLAWDDDHGWTSLKGDRRLRSGVPTRNRRGAGSQVTATIQRNGDMSIVPTVCQ